MRDLHGRKVPDRLIAAVAETTDRTVLPHYNADFDHIASVTGQPADVARQGSID